MKQCQRPSGWRGRIVLWLMNRRHSKLTDWGLQHLPIREDDYVLDVGCGGGRTVAKLADLASRGRVYGIDHAPASVAVARGVNQALVDQGRVNIQEASVSELPFSDGTFDKVTAIETHFWWPDLNRGMRETFRVLKPGGRMLVVSEFYNGAKYARYADRLAKMTTMAFLDVDQHKAMFRDAGFTEIAVDEKPGRGWICVSGTKPGSVSHVERWL
jgi:SAM-dependent methyltransferase